MREDRETGSLLPSERLSSPVFVAIKRNPKTKANFLNQGLGLDLGLELRLGCCSKLRHDKMH